MVLFKPNTDWWFRDYQESGYVRNIDYIMQGYKDILTVSPCGSGKGDLISYILASGLSRGSNMMGLAHRNELMIGPNALEERVQTKMGVPSSMVGIVGNKRTGHRRLLLGTVQTAVRRRHKLPHVDVLIYDEAHRTMTNTHLQVREALKERNPNLITLGFTATPVRADGKGLGDVYQKMNVLATHQEMVDRGFLVPTESIAPMDVDLTGVRIRAGEYVISDLEEVYDDKVLGSIIDVWFDYAPNRKTIVFTINSKKQANTMAEMYRRRGVLAEAITSDTKDPIGVLKRFERNEFQVLINVMKLTEGVSIDDVDCVVLAYNTKSQTKYIQSASRGARPVWDKKTGKWRMSASGEGYYKPNCLVIDVGCNYEDHGEVDHYGLHGFDISTKPKGPKGEAQCKKCPQCYHPVPIASRSCPSCGYTFPFQQHDDGMLATDVNWAKTNKNLSFFMQYSKMDFATIMRGLAGMNKNMGILLPIAVAKGWKEGWAVMTAAELKWTKADPSTAKGYDYILTQLKKHTKKSKAYWEVYTTLKSKRSLLV